MDHTNREPQGEASHGPGDRPQHSDEAEHHAGESAGPAGPGGPRWSSGGAAATAQAWLAQLQAIIDNLATQSAPVAREVGAKAAELAALAAERAGPLAQRAADVTAQVGVRVAERSRVLAADLRRGPEGPPGGGQGMAGAADSTEWAVADDATTASGREDTSAP